MADAFFRVDLAAVGSQLNSPVIFHPTFSSIAARLGFNGVTLDLATFGDEQDPRPFAKDDAPACILRNECVERGASGVDVVRAGKRLRAFAGIVGFIDR
ncbi:hypothetical protein ACN9MC_34780 (plasmid) [Ensifer adhaerens]|uniref:hypothetical protein n=1 Tax=Ensifer adhaerens TaxID=106592 RepID=UPI003CF161B4